MNTIKTIWFCLASLAGAFLLLSLFFWLGYLCGVSRPQPLRTIEEVQQQIGAKADGKLCKGWGVEGHSETQTKWDRYICNQYAAPYFQAEDAKLAKILEKK
jgi:hypothetical protein